MLINDFIEERRKFEIGQYTTTEHLIISLFKQNT
jgi:hypothetical protein